MHKVNTRAVPLLLSLVGRSPETSDWQLSHPQVVLVLIQPLWIFLSTHVRHESQCHYLIL